MVIYFSFLLMMLFFVFFSINKQINSSLIVLICFLLFLLSAFRFDTGIDTSAYQEIFYNPNPTLITKEKGFMMINQIIKFSGFSFQPVLMIFAFLTLFFLIKFILDESTQPALSLFIFFSFTPFYLQTMNTIRQTLSIYAFLFSLRFIKSRRFVPYLVVMCLCSFFAHASSLLLIPMYFLCNVKYSKGMRLLFTCGGFIGSFVLLKIIQYTPWAIYLKFSTPLNVMSPVFLMDLLICILLLCIIPYSNENKIEYNLCLFSFSLLLMCVALRKSPIYIVTSRFNEYFLPIIIILIPKLLEKFGRKRQIYTFITVVIFSGIYFLSIFVNGVKNELVPYKCFIGRFNEPVLFDFCFLILFVCLFLIISIIYDRKERGLLNV